MKEYWAGLTSQQKLQLVLKILIGILALVFAIRNWQSTEVILVFFKVNMPLTIIILLCVGAGFALSSVFDYKKFRIKDKEIEELKRKLNTLLDERGSGL